MRRISVGVVGAGFAADLHVRNLRRAAGVTVDVAGVAAGSAASAAAFADRYGIGRSYGSYAELLASDVDVVSVAVPNALHEEVVVAAAEAGKHVICEKPLTGAFGERTVTGVARAEQEWQDARESMDRVAAAFARNDVQFLYAENWVYAPAVTKVKRLLELSGGAIIDMRAEESHSGSHAARTRRRRTAGGGALLTMGAHPVSAVLHLKAFEADVRGGAPVEVESVTADLAALHESAAFAAGREHRWLVRDWDDVETWANLVVRFSDGSRAVVNASFAMLGGVRNLLEVNTTNAVYHANMTPNNELTAFTPDAEAFGQEHLHEKLESRTGWMAVSPDEDWIRGYPQEMQDFVESVIEGRPPVSGLALARDTLDVIYAGYLSAARGERVALDRPRTAGAAPALQAMS